MLVVGSLVMRTSCEFSLAVACVRSLQVHSMGGELCSELLVVSKACSRGNGCLGLGLLNLGKATC